VAVLEAAIEDWVAAEGRAPLGRYIERGFDRLEALAAVGEPQRKRRRT
jgi:hypothetical protein